MKNLDKYRGCLIGGAAGDALGYAVEFLSDDAIFDKYGKNGITEYKLINGVAQISDDSDSDSTGSVTGNILGAYLGLSNILQKFKDNLELYDVILEIADDLYNDCKISEYSSYRDEVWEQKYVYHTYAL